MNTEPNRVDVVGCNTQRAQGRRNAAWFAVVLATQSIHGMAVSKKGLAEGAREIGNEGRGKRLGGWDLWAVKQRTLKASAGARETKERFGSLDEEPSGSEAEGKRRGQGVWEGEA